jgi:hypothetical protein
MFKDQCSGIKWNLFNHTKDKVNEITKEKFFYFAGLKKKMRFFRCDNAGEYGKLNFYVTCLVLLWKMQHPTHLNKTVMLKDNLQQAFEDLNL